MDGEDLSNYDAVDERRQQKENDVDTLDQLERELTTHSLGLCVVGVGGGRGV